MSTGLSSGSIKSFTASWIASLNILLFLFLHLALMGSTFIISSQSQEDNHLIWAFFSMIYCMKLNDRFLQWNVSWYQHHLFRQGLCKASANQQRNKFRRHQDKLDSFSAVIIWESLKFPVLLGHIVWQGPAVARCKVRPRSICRESLLVPN